MSWKAKHKFYTVRTVLHVEAARRSERASSAVSTWKTSSLGMVSSSGNRALAMRRALERVAGGLAAILPDHLISRFDTRFLACAISSPAARASASAKKSSV